MSRRGGKAPLEQPETEQEKLDKEQFRYDIKHVMSHPSGRRFMMWLIDGKCNLWGGTFTGTSETFHLEGRRSVGIDVMQQLQEICPDLYAAMITDKMNEQVEKALRKKMKEPNEPQGELEDG